MKPKLFLILFVISGLLLVGQTITVNNPDGGEHWDLGTSYDIKWTSVGITTGTYKITLLKGEVILGVIATGLPWSQHVYSWKAGNIVGVTVPVGDDYKIKVKLQGEPISGKSNNNFSLGNLHINPAWLEKFKRYRRDPWPWWVDPPGPEPDPWFITMSLDRLKELVQNPPIPVKVGLWRGGKLLGILGRFESGRFIPERGNRIMGEGGLRVNLGARNHAIFLKGSGDFALQLLNAKTGKVLGNVGIVLQQKVQQVR